MKKRAEPMTNEQIVEQAERLARELQRELSHDARTRARLIELFGLNLLIARVRGGRLDWEGILEEVFPWPDEAESAAALAAARKRLGLD